MRLFAPHTGTKCRISFYMDTSHYNTLSAALLDNKILILDGAIGTIANKLVPGFSGSSDTLSITHPEIIASIHKSYIEAGADIISTNTLIANDVSMRGHDIVAINKAAAQIAVHTASQASHKVWVAGSICPTTYKRAYTRQIETLLENNVDALLIETIYDTHNARSAIDCVIEVTNNLGRMVPVMMSATLTSEGILPSGESINDLIAVASKCPTLLTIGLNCGSGPLTLGQYLPKLTKAEVPLSFHPNAGLPDSSGQYRLTPEDFCRHTLQAAACTYTRVIGGCCGTTPAHIAALSEHIKSINP